MCIEGEYCPWERERLSGVWLEEEEVGFEGSTAPDDNRRPYFVLLHYL